MEQRHLKCDKYLFLRIQLYRFFPAEDLNHLPCEVKEKLQIHNQKTVTGLIFVFCYLQADCFGFAVLS